MTNLIFDDISFCFGKNGISYFWENVLREWKFTAPKAGVNLTILNRSNYFSNFGFEMVPFPATKWGEKYPAVDRNTVQKVLTTLCADVYLPSYYRFALDTPTLQIVYDLIPEQLGFSDVDRHWLERKLAFFGSDRLISISNATKSEISRFYPNQKNNCSNIASPAFDSNIFFKRTKSEVEEFRNNFGISGKYLLVPDPGVFSRNQVFSEVLFRAIQQGKLQEFEIVFCGGMPFSEQQVQVCRKANQKITRIQIDEIQLAVAYSGSEAALFPSLFEGVGIVMSQSISCGTPIVCPLNSSLDELTEFSIFQYSENSVDDFCSKIDFATNKESKMNLLHYVQKTKASYDWSSVAEIILGEAIECSNIGINRSPHLQNILSEYSQMAQLYQS